MNKMLVVLGKNKTMKDISDGPPPYAEVRLLDCRNGEAGNVVEFDEGWVPLLKKYFGEKIPEWVRILSKHGKTAEIDEFERVGHIGMLMDQVASNIAELRKISTSPFSIPVSPDGKVSIELYPVSVGDNRVTVGCKLLGNTVVSYTDDGLLIEVFSGDDSAALPISSLQFSAYDLEKSSEDGCIDSNVATP